MLRVFIIHGFGARPNGAWRPWLMGELAHKDIWSCALAMPTPEHPIAQEWVAEITRAIAASTESDDKVVLIGHSLGVPAILRYLESDNARAIAGAVLIAGPIEGIGKAAINDFLAQSFAFDRVREKCGSFRVIHAVDDGNVPFAHAERLAAALDAPLTRLPSGGHLNGSGGTYTLPSALDAIGDIVGA